MARRKAKSDDAKVASDAEAAAVPALPGAPAPVAAEQPGIFRGARGPESAYTAEIGIFICDLIAECKTLNQCVEALEANGTPVGRRTILKWLSLHTDFSKMYARAHEMQADHDADEIREITRRVVGPHREGEESLKPDAARIAIDALKWSAGKRKPKVYGDKVEVDTPADGGIAKAAAVTMAALAALAERKP